MHAEAFPDLQKAEAKREAVRAKSWNVEETQGAGTNRVRPGADRTITPSVPISKGLK